MRHGPDGRRDPQPITAFDPWFLRQIARSSKKRASARNGLPNRRGLRASNDGLLRRAPRQADRQDEARGRARRTSWRAPGLQAHRHLRRRVRGQDALHVFHLRTGRRWATRRRMRGGAFQRRKKVIILGGGPNRIGQGIEFDYCCCHAASPDGGGLSKPSWSTATPRPSRPTTTPPTACISSR
jgi:carbamoyl-phosphate synthase large subunit